MGQPHKHAALIKAWADGAEIQDYDEEMGRWCNSGRHPMWSAHKQYRIKPKTIKYRNFLWKPLAMSCPERIIVGVCAYEENLQEPRDSWRGFVKWLGDWQEAEV